MPRDIVRKRRSGATCQPERLALARRAPLALQRAQVPGAAQAAHLAENPVAPRRRVAGTPVDAQAQRIRQHRGQQRGLRGAQAPRGLVPETLRRGLHAVDAVTELRNVQIHLENPLLGPQRLDQHGEVGLKGLPHEAVTGAHEPTITTGKKPSRALRTNLCPGHRKRFFATCCEMVLAPRRRLPRSLARTASRMESKSKPAWSGNCWSSEAITALAACAEICSRLTHWKSVR